MKQEKEKIDEIVLSNIGLIYKVIKDMNCYWRTNDEFQDLYDAGILGLIYGSKQYKNDISKPGTFLYTCIKNEIVKYLYLSNMLKRRKQKEYTISLDKEINIESEDTYIDFIVDPDVNIEEDTLKNIEIEKVMNAVDNLKSKKNKMILYDYYGLRGTKQLSIIEMTKKYKICKQAIYKRMKRSIASIKKYLITNKKDAYKKEKL